MTRPVSIAVIGWLIVAGSIEGLIGTLGGIATPLFTSGLINLQHSVSATLWMGGIALVMNIALGALILAGFGWARVVYMVFLALAILGIAIHHQPLSLLVVAGSKLVVFGYFLFRREANQYFSAHAAGAA